MIERKRQATVLACVGFLTACSVSVRAEVECEPGRVAFKGRCVAQNDCCDPDLCPLGQVFEYRDRPECVPCSEAQTQSGMTFCAATERASREQEVEGAYDELMRMSSERFGEAKANLREAQKKWRSFRAAWCDMVASGYEGGTMQPMVHAMCLESEAAAQVKRLRDLKDEWNR